MKFTEQFTQNLCDEGIKLRREFRSITMEMSIQDRKKIVQSYFLHKNRCLKCDTTWHELKP